MSFRVTTTAAVRTKLIATGLPFERIAELLETLRDRCSQAEGPDDLGREIRGPVRGWSLDLLVPASSRGAPLQVSVFLQQHELNPTELIAIDISIV